MSHNLMDRFIRFKYNDENLQHIQDCESRPVLSLDSALEPLLSQIDQLDHYKERAKQLRQYPSKHGLTKDESAAVFLYTDNCDSQSLNRILNKILQSNDRTTLTPWLDFLKLFYTALRKLPTVTNTIWRGLPTDIAKELKENQELVLSDVTSCSSSDDIIRHFLKDNSLLCSIKPLNGKDICGYTSTDGDKEVLLLPGTRLQVKHKTSNNGEAAIYLEEISTVKDEQLQSDGTTMLGMKKCTDEGKTDVDESETRPTTASKDTKNRSIPKNDRSQENAIQAVITFSTGDRYKIVYRDGKKQDHGKYYYVNGEECGDKEADQKANGEGICAFSNGEYFIGRFNDGIRHGHGILYDKNGSITAGDWAHDQLINQTLKIMSTSNRYEWRDDKNMAHWYGAYYDDNENKYIGSVVDGKADGLGIRIWFDKSQYEGNFKHDKKHGYGIYHYSDRTMYMGQWTDDEINGHGKLSWSSGTWYEGQFNNGKRHSYGKLLFSNGQQQEGKWENDEYID